MTEAQYARALICLAFRALIADKSRPPTPSECMLYQSVFEYQRAKQEKLQ